MTLWLVRNERWDIPVVAVSEELAKRLAELVVLHMPPAMGVTDWVVRPIEQGSREYVIERTKGWFASCASFADQYSLPVFRHIAGCYHDTMCAIGAMNTE